MTEVGNIVTLENGQEYLVLEELSKDNTRYVYSVRILQDDTPTDEYLIFEAINNEGEEYLKPVEEKEKYDALIEDFKDIIADKIINFANEDFEMEEEA
jgi:hypothetical protein